MSASERYLQWVTRGGISSVWCTIIMGIWWGVMAGMGFGGVGLGSLPIFLAGGWFIGGLIGHFVVGGSGWAARETLLPTAMGTYAQGHSEIQALEAQERFVEAVEAWEVVAVAQPLNPWPLIRAGELYRTRLNEPHLARERFLHARDLEGITPELRRYTMQKLIDLYLGPLQDEGRALVELRRMIEQHPGTADADAARRAIASIKAQRSETADER